MGTGPFPAFSTIFWVGVFSLRDAHPTGPWRLDCLKTPSLMPLGSTVGKEPAWSLERGPDPRDPGHDDTFPSTPAAPATRKTPDPLALPEGGDQAPPGRLCLQERRAPHVPRKGFLSQSPRGGQGAGLSCLAKAPLGEY